MSQSIQRLDTSLMNFSRELSDHGLHAALGFLNARTRHRFTGVYRFDPPMLRNISLFDRENPSLRSAHDALLRDSYCSHIADTGQPLAVDDCSEEIMRDADGPASSVLAYHGVPLHDLSGRCFGSLCHWDVRPRLVPPGEWRFLFVVAPVIALVVATAPAEGVTH